MPPVDIFAGMASQKAGDRQRTGDPALWNRSALHGHFQLRRLTAAASAEELPVAAVVQIDQVLAAHRSGIKTGGAGEIFLLGGGEQDLQRRMRQAVVLQNGQRERHADSIVRAQCCAAVGIDPVAFDLPPDGIGLKVVRCARRFFTDHVHVRLKHHAGSIFVLRGGGLSDQHVPVRIPMGFKPALAGPVEQIPADLFLAEAGVRNLTQGVKMAEYRFLQQTLLFCIHSNVSYS